MRVRYFALAAIVAVLDLAAKAWIAQRISLDSGRGIVVIPNFFSLVHTRNAGVVFGILNDAPARWQWLALVSLSTAIAAVVVMFLWRQPERRWTLSGAALALVLGGALGNLIDRAVHGAVTDFLDFYYGTYHWHTFNLADSAIVIGATLLAWEMLFPADGRSTYPSSAEANEE